MMLTHGGGGARRSGMGVSCGGQAAEEDVLRPAVLVALGVLEQLWPQIAVRVLMLQGVAEDRLHLFEQSLVLCHKG